ncbi:MAG: hypothetical protein KDA91_24470 [Planctomycetaceae bacterium]|nr:hypothetical protein [Planctomycetaceae bacterium]
MTDKAVLPNAQHVNRIVVGLFGDEAIARANPKPVEFGPNTVVVKYADDNSQVQRLVVCDVAFANNAGAALTMISPGVVADAIKANDVPDNILDNFREVMNIFVNIFQDTGHGHLVLGGIDLPTKEKDESTAKALAEPVGRADFEVVVPRYGTGRITLLAC